MTLIFPYSIKVPCLSHLPLYITCILSFPFPRASFPPHYGPIYYPPFPHLLNIRSENSKLEILGRREHVAFVIVGLSYLDQDSVFLFHDLISLYS